MATCVPKVCPWSVAASSESVAEYNGVIAWYDEEEWLKVLKDSEVASSFSDSDGLSAKSLPVLNPDSVTYDEFFSQYLSKNIPCMFASEVTSSWLSRRDWTTNGSHINFDNLLQVYGEAPVSAANCDDTEYREGYGTRDCRDMRFQEFVDYWKEYRASEYSSTMSCLYLKDWHIVRFHQKNSAETVVSMPYETPPYFQSDWLNEVSDEKDEDDFKFCYMGPKGSYTSFHADVYGSYSWSANVVGRKKWYLYPPGKELIFYKAASRGFQFNWNDSGHRGRDYIEVIQEAGECLFVPSGWHHVVWNMTDTISINHNWFNGVNICYVWTVLQNALRDVERELEDLSGIPEFCEQCQLVLKANHGMNYRGFFEILKTIYSKRKSEVALSSQAKFDMEAINHVILHHCAGDDTVKRHFMEDVSWFTEQF